MSDIDICLDFHRCYGVLLSSAVVCDGLELSNLGMYSSPLPELSNLGMYSSPLLERHPLGSI